ncbi:hypothetical protein AAFF_G00207910 [Aldrovandia affinis]|uniref:Uncharacterized protein n=1 Tax=Aldrovandia affinis TaxID=143900 RepID=A0AAD7RH12_9TELE|nr:hypothetical protein AAFF_G00207910 [Aldrovandia affinis]
MKYVAQGLKPFSLVEQEPFKVFVKDLLPNAKMTRVTLRSMIDDASKEMKVVTEAMTGVDHFAPPPTAGLSEGGASLVLLPIGLTLTVSTYNSIFTRTFYLYFYFRYLSLLGTLYTTGGVIKREIHLYTPFGNAK